MKIKSKGKKLNKAWLHDHLNDPYVKLAQKEGYRARAAYKLKEIDEELRLLRPGQLVVDLGAAPGAWSQYLRRKFAPRGAAGGALEGEIIALDILDFEPIDGVRFLQGDFREAALLQELERLLAGDKVGLVLSDMSPNISGVSVSDQARGAHLAELALEFARNWLKPEGALLVKLFQGCGFTDFLLEMRKTFRAVSSRKPGASRDRSPEVYLLGRNRKT